MTQGKKMHSLLPTFYLKKCQKYYCAWFRVNSKCKENFIFDKRKVGQGKDNTSESVIKYSGIQMENNI